MPSDLLVVVVGAGCAAAGGVISTVISSAVARRQARRDAGSLEVASKRQLDLYEATRDLVGHLAATNHQIAWVSRADGSRVDRGRIEAGRRSVIMARELTRSQQLNLGPEVQDAVLTATDTANALFNAASSGAPGARIIALRTKWREELEVITRTIHGSVQVATSNALERGWRAGAGG